MFHCLLYIEPAHTAHNNDEWLVVRMEEKKKRKKMYRCNIWKIKDIDIYTESTQGDAGSEYIYTFPYIIYLCVENITELQHDGWCSDADGGLPHTFVVVVVAVLYTFLFISPLIYSVINAIYLYLSSLTRFQSNRPKADGIKLKRNFNEFMTSKRNFNNNLQIWNPKCAVATWMNEWNMTAHFDITISKDS